MSRRCPVGWHRQAAAVMLFALGGLMMACGGTYDLSDPPSGPARVAVATIEVAPLGANLAVTGRQSFTATLHDAGGAVLTDRSVTWTSDQPGVASVSPSGNSVTVTGVAPGLAHITATIENHSAAVVVTVASAVTASVGATGGSISAPGGGARVDIPSGAVSGTGATVSITPVAGAATSSVQALGTAYQIAVTGGSVSAMTVTVPYRSDALANGIDERTLGLFALVNGTWTFIPGARVDVPSKTLIAPFTFANSTSACVGTPVRDPSALTIGGFTIQYKIQLPTEGTTLHIGDHRQLSATTNGSAAPDAVTWASCQPNVASVTLSSASSTGAAADALGLAAGSTLVTSAFSETIAGFHLTVTDTMSLSVLANPTLTVFANGTGTGTISSSPAGILCTASAVSTSGTCSGSFGFGSQVTLTAAPNNGSTFTGWTGSCSGQGPCVVTMDQAKSVTASFGAPPGQTLTLLGGGTGSGTITSTPLGISCTVTNGSASSNGCSANFPFGTPVTLTASTTNGSTLTGWSGACSGIATCTVTMDQPRSVTASFTAATPVLTIVAAGPGTGTIVSSPAGINCTITTSGASGNCTASFQFGTTLTLTATATNNSTFGGWSGACTTTSASCTITMNQARTVTATFNAPGLQALTIGGGGNGSGIVASAPTGISCIIANGTVNGACSASFSSNTLVTLTAAAANGSIFAGWSGVCSGTGQCQVTMSQARSVTANFSRP